MAIVPCSNTPPVLGIVQFVAAEFNAAWPEFAGLSVQQEQNAFNLASLFLANTCQGRVFNAQLRQTLLYMLTAHIAFLNSGTNDGAGNITPPPGIVGRINTATQGSVSVGAEMVTTADSTFYMQTKYGAQFWAATARFRTAIYISPYITNDGPWGEGPYGGGFGPWGGGCGR